MRDLSDPSANYSGQLLLAHPNLGDPNFFRAVILLSGHSDTDGALGVIINRPLGKTLSEHAPEFSASPLADIPLFEGGPVQNDQMILAAWEFQPEQQTFKLYFGIDAQRAEEILETHPEAQLRGFLGYAGWKAEQLELELEGDSWVLAPLDGSAVQKSAGEALWKTLLGRQNPEMRFEAEAPEDPSVN